MARVSGGFGGAFSVHELVVLVGSTRLMLGLGFAYVVLVVMCVREETEMNKVLYTTIIAHAPVTGERDVRFLLLLSRPCSHYHIFYFVRARMRTFPLVLSP